jgi:hypothetical protein
MDAATPDETDDTAPAAGAGAVPIDFDADALRWLVARGRVRSLFGTELLDERLHLVGCGVDVGASGRVAAGAVESFVDTFSEPAERAALVADVVCACGQVSARLEHPPLPLGALLATVAAFAVEEHLEVEAPSGFVVVSFVVEGATVRGDVSFDDTGAAWFVPFRVRSGPVRFSDMVAVFGEPTVTTL